MDDRQRRQFRWGVLLAWSFPVIFVVLTMVTVAREISTQKTSGLGAVAGATTLAFTHFGIVTATVFQICAIVLLIRAWPGGQRPFRVVITLISLGCAVITLCVCGAATWFFVRRMLH
jgi:hypothetical protein